MKKINLLGNIGVVSIALGQLLLAGCEQNYGIVAVEKKAAPAADTTAPTNTTVNPPAGKVLASSAEAFDAATAAIKKIDFLFVVDNSKSMNDKQLTLASGFENFANTFYRRADLDICTMIITTDRYLGKTNGSYANERPVNCTKPAGYETKSAAEMQTYIDALIADFKTKINVGVDGSPSELPGKSLVSFLYGLNAWGEAIKPSITTNFFRADSVPNISFLTDENNWYVKSDIDEPSNDLPAIANSMVPNTKLVDLRKGIKDYLDDFFGALRPGQGLNYSTTSFIEFNPPNKNRGIAQNLAPLMGLIGRESAQSDIEGSASSYTSVYQSIAEGLVQRASSFSVAHNIYEPGLPNSVASLKVNLLKISGEVVPLNFGADYTVLLPNGISLSSAISSSVQPGDKISVSYSYLLP